MISEKEMEDQIAAAPERFLGERQLTLVSRQLRIGSYIFDLLFEDRHGGKLIVEIQRGTLNREHTYKILDYYDEYRERNPAEFIDVMVVANQITAERKKRLHALGIAFRELPESLYTAQLGQPNEPVDSMKGQPVSNELDFESVQSHSAMETNRTGYHFRSIGPSAFVESTRNVIKNNCDPARWKLGGESSLTAEFIPASSTVGRMGGAGLRAQIWMERPKKGSVSCKFEIYGVTENIALRENIAASMRDHLQKHTLPIGVVTSTGSTIVKCRLSVPLIQEATDDTSSNAGHYSGEISKLVAFFKFLDSALKSWCG